MQENLEIVYERILGQSFGGIYDTWIVTHWLGSELGLVMNACV